MEAIFEHIGVILIAIGKFLERDFFREAVSDIA